MASTAQRLAAPVTPRLRGVLHRHAFFVSLVAGAALVVTADAGAERTAAAVYAASVAGLFGTSALYHRTPWRSERTRRRVRRLDHSMIFVLIAGTFTPFATLSVGGRLGEALLAAVWAGAAGGIVLKLAWIDAPAWLTAGLYVLLGWSTTLALPALVQSLGVLSVALVGLGGLLYTAGAVVYARQRPDPRPDVFGYHEVFHVLVVLAAALQYGVVAFAVL